MGIAPQHKRSLSAVALWVLGDGRIGHERQSLALANALGTIDHYIAIRWPAPWSWAAPRQWPGLSHWASRSLPVPQGPTLVVACGRRTSQAALYLRRRHPEWVRLVQILDPRRHRHEFDALVLPEHDTAPSLAPSHRNAVIRIRGSLHDWTPSSLNQARQHWTGIWPAWPQPRIGILLGGGAPSQLLRQWRDIMRVLPSRLANGGCVLCTFSRRTPKALITRVRENLSAWPGICWHPDDAVSNSVDMADTNFGAANPYPGILALADEFWVAPDSINLISEAMATGKPVRVYGEPARDKHRRFLEPLLEQRQVTSIFEQSQPTYIPWQPLPEVVSRLRERLRWD